jgi:hypothetical protein
VSGVALGVGALAAGFVPKLITGAGVLSPLRLPALLSAAFGLVHLVAVVALLPRVSSGAGWQAFTAQVRQVPRVLAEAGNVAARQRTLRLLLLCAGAFGFAWVPFEVLWQPQLAVLLGGAADRTEVFGLLATGGFFASAVGSWLGPRVVGWVGGRDRAATMAMLLLAAGLVGFALARTPWVAAAWFAVPFVANGLWAPPHRGLLHDTVDDAHRTTVLSGSSFAMELAVVGTQLTLMPLADGIGIPAALVVTGIVAVAGGFAHRGLGRTATPSRVVPPHRPERSRRPGWRHRSGSRPPRTRPGRRSARGRSAPGDRDPAAHDPPPDG